MRRPGMLGTVSIFALLVGLATSGCAVWRIQQGAELVRQSEPFQASPARAGATLLVVGDSTAVGTGASSPATSVVGLIGRDHPDLKIVNRAQDGAKFADMAQQLDLPAELVFDAVLVLGGGNDVMRMTRDEALEREVGRVLALAARRAKLVVLMPSGNVGNAPFFFPPLSWVMTERSKSLHRIARQAAADNGALYVNLYQNKADDPFAQRPDEFNSRDKLHPNDAGYQLWYRQLNAQAALSAKLAALR